VTARKTLLIGIDGLRIDDALAPDEHGACAMPELAAFVAAGTLVPMRMQVPTISGPGWSSILGGVPHAAHGVVDNSFRAHTIDPEGDLLSRAWAADPTTTTFAVSSWAPIVDPAGPGPIIADRAEHRRSGQHRLVVRDGELYGYDATDAEVTAATVLAIRDWGPDVSFVYLGLVDEAGHLYGGTAPEYRVACLQTDARLGRVLAALEARIRAHDEDWLVGITTDHGHLDEGGHGGADEVLTRSFLALRRYGGGAVPRPTTIEPHEVRDLLLAHRA
jgi:predicted AlkP superfamily pyrophosphatase or phosphodiesterase